MFIILLKGAILEKRISAYFYLLQLTVLTKEGYDFICGSYLLIIKIFLSNLPLMN